MFGCGGHVSIYSIAKVKSGEVVVVIVFRGSREPTAASRGVVHIEERSLVGLKTGPLSG